MIKKYFIVVTTVLGSLLTGCASSNTGGVPNFVSAAQVEKMSATAWNEKISDEGISDDQVQTDRFTNIANRLIAVSDLARETWDIKLLDSYYPNVFGMTGNRLGASSIDAMTDERIAALTAYGIAAVELKHGQKNISRQMMAQLSATVAGRSEEARRLRLMNALGAGTGIVTLPPTPEMREEAQLRAKELVQKAGFTPDFPQTTY